VQRRLLNRFIAVFVAAIISSVALSAATRPVSVGLNDNWEQWIARSANVGWVRIDFVWFNIEPSRNSFNWNEPEAHVNEALANGQQIVAILHYAPSWATGSTNPAVPPLSTGDWAEFVKQLAIKYNGRIAAYEIWNEPDTSGASGGGIGWDRNVEEPPLYTDFVHTAAQQIRTYAPGTLVVGPAYRTHSDGFNSQADNRKRRFFQEMQAVTYPDGPGPSFLDVTSYHNNASDTEASKDMGLTLRTNNLAYLSSYLPSKAGSPIWVTEYGWRSNAVGTAGQREKECNETKIYTGLLEGPYTGLTNYNITRAFIYSMKEGGSAAIFNGDNSPKPVVTQYLQKLAYPAVQNPALSADYPNCNGTSLTSPTIMSAPSISTETFDAWKALGLRDPRPALPAGYAAVEAEQSPNGRSMYLSFKGRGDSVISVSSRPAAGDDVQFVSDSAAEWTRGDAHVSVRWVAGTEPARGWARTLAASVDPNFGKACLDDRQVADDGAVRALGFTPPAAPRGFRALDQRFDLTTASAGCAATQTFSQFGSAKNIDFVWSFVADSGEILRAGIYRYGDGFKGDVVNPASLHWSDGSGTRYWVAVEAKELTPALKDALYTVAASLDPSFAKRPVARQSRETLLLPH
jgi:hypothetical protein